jgi:hypothetical protein
MQGIERDPVAGEAELAEQRLGACCGIAAGGVLV